jgi:hypothetical protein
MVKYVFYVDYPRGKKEEYLEWVKSIAGTLQAPEEVKRIRSYDSYLSESPHRVVEFEFDDTAAAAKYFERQEIKKILQEELLSHGDNIHVNVLTLRGDYTKM